MRSRSAPASDQTLNTVVLHVGGVNQEAEFATVQFVRSPYKLSLVSTPPFIKPGLPYYIQVRRQVSWVGGASRLMASALR